MQLKTVRVASGEARKVSNQWAAEAEARATTVASSTWATTTGTLSGATLTATTASVLLAGAGCGTLTNTATLANGEVLVATRLIEVR